MKAPSSKNRQPWKFIVVQGDSKSGMAAAFRKGLERERNSHALLPGSSMHIEGAERSAAIIEEAPVAVLVLNTLGRSPLNAQTAEERIGEICNTLSIGAAIENMLLAASDRGIGSLWICDIFFAYPELSEWIGEESPVVSAIAFGYPAEAPLPRPRKNPEDIVEWRV